MTNRSIALIAALIIIAGAGSTDAAQPKPTPGGKSAAVSGKGPVKVHELLPPVETLADGRRRLIWLDFGFLAAEAGTAWNYDGSAPNPTLAWKGGIVRLTRRDGALDRPGAGDFFEGDDATFVISVGTSETCHLLVTLGDMAAPRGPVAIDIPEGRVASGILTRADSFADVEFETKPVDGIIAIHLSGEECGSFAIVSLAIWAPPGTLLGTNLFPGRPAGSRTVPGEAGPDSTASDSTAAAHLLRTACDYLIAYRPADGCFSSSGSWYQAAYAVRTLMAGARLLDSPSYRDAAFECLDRMVEEQRPEGAWSASYIGRRGCALAKQNITESTSANLADVGVAVAALSIAASVADPPRRESYLAAARRFVEQIALPNQFPDGSFPNLRYGGTDWKNPYSVATGVQALNLAAFYSQTGDARSLAGAEQAARFLLDGFSGVGRYQFRNFDRPAATPIQLTRFGDLYYILEGLTWVHRYTGDPALAKRIEVTLDAYFWGPGGLSGSRIDDALWGTADRWEASKMGGLLAILKEYEAWSQRSVAEAPGDATRAHHLADTKRWIHDYLVTLGSWETANRIGFTVDPASPDGTFAFPATGFAGVGLSATIDPDILYPPVSAAPTPPK